MKNWKPQSVPDSGKTGTSREFQNPRHFAMCPKPLTLDKSVSDGAFRVFALIALQNFKKGRKTPFAQISTRELAVAKGCSHTTIRRWVQELCASGSLEKLGGPRGRATYRLTAPIFEGNVSVTTKAGKVIEVGSAELAQARAAKSQCPKCRRSVRISSTSGVCDRCLSAWAARTA